ncbi:MAG: 2OG-Fe(II) oxygenase family protein [Ilumatobacteraceae bacterium]
MGVPTFSLPALVDTARAAHGAGGSDLLDQLEAALRDPGAFRLADVPITETLLAEMHAATSAFFELPMEAKAVYRYVDDQYVGWCGGEFLGQYGSVDRKEMFHIGPRVAPTLADAAHRTDGSLPELDASVVDAAAAGCTLWPTAPAAFVPVWHEYYLAMQHVAALLGEVLATLLDISSDEWFAVMGGNWADLAANYYPALDPDEAGAPVYNAAHKDLTVFTVLHQDQSRIGGLSVQSADGSWDDVAPVPGTYVFNVGELLTYLSGGRWRAAPHRVTVSTAAAGTDEARISVPFFYRPSDHRVVTSFVDPAAPAVAVGAWVLDRKQAVSSAST